MGQWRFDLGEGPIVEAEFDPKTGNAEFMQLDERLQVTVRVGSFDQIVAECKNLTKFAVDQGWLSPGQASYRRGLMTRWHEHEVNYRKNKYGQ